MIASASPPLGFCHRHPAAPAVVRLKTPWTGRRWRRFCAPCWREYYRGTARPLPVIQLWDETEDLLCHHP